MEPRKHAIPRQRGVEGIPRVRVRGELRAPCCGLEGKTLSLRQQVDDSGGRGGLLRKR